MTKRKSVKRFYLMASMIAVMLLIFSSTVMAAFVTSNLTITPTPCKRGDVLHFSASVYNNPAATTAPGTAYFGSVALDNANSPELTAWHSEYQVFKYPYPGNTTPMNFTSTYTVPQDLKGNTICFYVLEGKNTNNRISYKHCIQVKPKIPLLNTTPKTEIKPKIPLINTTPKTEINKRPKQ